MRIKKNIFTITLLLIALLSSAQETIKFEELSFFAPKDFTILSNCTVFEGNNDKIAVTIESKYQEECNPDSIVAKTNKLVAERGFVKVNNKVETLDKGELRGFYFETRKDKQITYFLVFLIDKTKKESLITISCKEEDKKQALEVMKSFNLCEEPY